MRVVRRSPLIDAIEFVGDCSNWENIEPFSAMKKREKAWVRKRASVGNWLVLEQFEHPMIVGASTFRVMYFPASSSDERHVR